jgi:hypothetical protein
MFGSIIILLLLPLLYRFPLMIGTLYRLIFVYIYWALVGLTCFLGWVGTQPIEYPFAYLSQLGTLLYFSYFYLYTYYNINNTLIDELVSFVIVVNRTYVRDKLLIERN